jgi:monoamine oxidase
MRRVPEFDCILIGAGAAGIAAGRMLHDAGLRVLILEAQDHIGGRARTDYTFANIPVELGAEFIHGDRAVTHDLVRQAGLTIIPVDRMGKLRWGKPAALAADQPEDVRAMLDGLHRDYAALKDADLPDDCSLADYFKALGWSGKALYMADVLFGQTACAKLDDLSAHDLQREMRVDTSGGEFGGEARIAEGYSSLWDWYSRDLNIALSRPVTRIIRDASDVTIHAGGRYNRTTYTARVCLITIPVAAFQADKIRFEPALSPAKQNAIKAFRVDPATKLLYRFERPFWSDDVTYLACYERMARWWTPGHGRPDADPLMSCYITADRARAADQIPYNDAVIQGINTLADVLGVSLGELGSAAVDHARVSWAEHPYIRGGYAHLPPGHASAREALAKPEGDLFFAGEATAYDSSPQTVHGAIQSGWRAAREVMARLNGES